MQTIKLYSGMTGEYEVIRTNAPITLLEKQLRINNKLQDNNQLINDPYVLLTSKGYKVELVASCIDSIELDTLQIDHELDYYNY